MTQIYGHKWVSSHGEYDHDDTWSKGLVDISGEQLATGFKACIKSGEAWPPSLSEFRALCKPPKRENAEMYRVPSTHHIEKKRTPEEKATIHENIQKLKAGIGA